MKSIINTQLDTFNELEGEDTFEQKAQNLLKTILANIKKFGILVLDEASISMSPLDINFPTVYIASIQTIVIPYRKKRLTLFVRNDKKIQFGVFVCKEDETSSWQEIIKSEFMSMYDFNDLFIEIIRNLK